MTTNMKTNIGIFQLPFHQACQRFQRQLVQENLRCTKTLNSRRNVAKTDFPGES
jgi:hypothetical protein